MTSGTMLTAFRIRSSAASTASRHGMIRSGAMRVPSVVVWRSASTNKCLHHYASRPLFCYRREAARTLSSCGVIRHSSSSSSGHTEESRLTPIFITTVDAPLLKEQSLTNHHVAASAASFSTATKHRNSARRVAQERRAKLAAKKSPALSFANDNNEWGRQLGNKDIELETYVDTNSDIVTRSQKRIANRRLYQERQAQERLELSFANDNNEGGSQLGDKEIELETDVDINSDIATPIAFTQVMDDLKQARQEYYVALGIPESWDVPHFKGDLFKPFSVLSAENFQTIRKARAVQMSRPHKASFQQLEETETTYRNLCHLYRHAVVESFRYASLIPNPQGKIREAYRALLLLSEYEYLRAQREIMMHNCQEEMTAKRIQEEANKRKDGALDTVKSLFKAAFETQKEVDPETKDDEPNIVDNIITAHRDPDFTPNQNLYEFLIKEDFNTSTDKVHYPSAPFYYQVMLLMKDSFRLGNPHVKPNNHMYSLFFTRLVMTGTLADASAAELTVKETLCEIYKEENNLPHLNASEADTAFMSNFKLFLPVFRLYREAAKVKHPDFDRRDAALGAVRLLTQLMNGSRKDPMTTSSGQYTDWQTKCNAHRLVLNTMLNADPVDFVHVFNRTNNIMESFMGEENWKRLLSFDTAEKLDSKCLTSEWINRGLNSPYGSSLLVLLINIYASVEKSRYLDRATSVLRFLEHLREIDLKQQRLSKLLRLPPFSPTYDVVLTSMLNITFSGYSWKSSHIDESLLARQKGVVEKAEQMVECMMSQPPDLFFAHPRRSTFHILLKMRGRMMPHAEAGDIAEAILSRMQIRHEMTLSGTSLAPFDMAQSVKPVVGSYGLALNCMISSATAQRPGAMHRALLLLNRMEGQCMRSDSFQFDRRQTEEHGEGVPGSDDESDDGARGFSVTDAVYDESVQPDVRIYTKVIEVCANTRLTSDRAEALEVAFDVYNRMIDHGVAPNEDTFAVLLLCCDNLLPDVGSDLHRATLASHVFSSACEQNQVTDALLQTLKRCNFRLYNSYMLQRKENVVTTGWKAITGVQV